MMKILLIVLTYSIINYHALGQSIQGIWIGKYMYPIGVVEDSIKAYYRVPAVYDFYSHNEVLIGAGTENSINGKFKKLRKDRYLLKTTYGKDELEFVDSTRFKLYPRRIKKNQTGEVFFFDRADKNTLQISQDSIRSLAYDNIWSISFDLDDYRFEINDPEENKLMLIRSGGVEKTPYGFVLYKDYYFFAFNDPFFGDFILQLNEYSNNEFVSYNNNFNTPNDTLASSNICLKMEKRPTANEIELQKERLIGHWKADVTNWKVEYMFDDSTIITLSSVARNFKLDSVVYNEFEFELNEDSTYKFTNQGCFIKDSTGIEINKIITGRWILSPSLEYFELIPDESDLVFEGRYYVKFSEINNEMARFGLTVPYNYNTEVFVDWDPYDFYTLAGFFTFEKVE